jgi:hypothetical protein
MYTLVHRKTAGKGVLLAFTLATAILGTTQIVLRLTEGAIFMRFLRQGTTFDSTSLPLADLGATYDSLILAQNAIFAINKFVTYLRIWFLTNIHASLVTDSLFVEFFLFCFVFEPKPVVDQATT